MKWKLVPEEPTEEMITHGTCLGYGRLDVLEIYRATTAVAPAPEHDRMTKEEAQAFQNWKGMDGAVAFHLIERHANGWSQSGMMMEAWLEANKI